MRKSLGYNGFTKLQYFKWKKTISFENLMLSHMNHAFRTVYFGARIEIISRESDDRYVVSLVFQ